MLKAVLFATSTMLALAGCDRPPPVADRSAKQDVAGPASSDAPVTADAATASLAPSPPAPSPPEATPTRTPVETAALPAAAELTPDQKGEKGARAVIAEWASSLESGDLVAAWKLYERDTDPSRAAFVHWWQRYRAIKVTFGPGEMDAGAGSSFYTAPVTVTGRTVSGKPIRLEGPINLRRVNDIDGATPDQLRWHIGNTDLKDVSGR